MCGGASVGIWLLKKQKLGHQQAFHTSNLECGPAFCFGGVNSMDNEKDSRATRRNNIGDRAKQFQVFSQSAGFPAEIWAEEHALSSFVLKKRAAAYVHCDMICAGGRRGF